MTTMPNGYTSREPSAFLNPATPARATPRNPLEHARGDDRVGAADVDAEEAVVHRRRAVLGRVAGAEVPRTNRAGAPAATGVPSSIARLVITGGLAEISSPAKTAAGDITSTAVTAHGNATNISTS